jgi:predicted deacetylase
VSAKFVIRFDDISPEMSWTKFQVFEDLAKSLGLQYLVGVIPNCQDESLRIERIKFNFWDKIREWKNLGWTIAQHGYSHQYVNHSSGILGISSNSEFSELPLSLQLDTLKKGKIILEEQEIWEPVFMAPSHSFDINTLEALTLLDFKYITDGYGVYPYRMGNLIALPQLFSKPFNFGFGIYTICIHTNTITSKESNRIVKFIETNSSNIISFYSAVELQPKFPSIAALARNTTSLTLRITRNLKRIRSR